jgi:glucose-6-phosphate 1-dehydrogenase
MRRKNNRGGGREPSAAQAPLAPPSIMVIFGGGGDLAKRKLIPALYNLSKSGLLPERFAVIAVGNQDFSSDSYRDHLDSWVRNMTGDEFSDETWGGIKRRLHYLKADFRDPGAYDELKSLIGQINLEDQMPGNCLFYLATPPVFFAEIPTRLAEAGLTREKGGRWRRVIVEKPFGRDLASARKLNRDLLANLEEDQIYRIDHYLGKETVQNIIAYRFANSTTEPLWNRNYIDHIQITVAESLGVEERAGYYDRAGALRDMIPNHLLVVLGVVAMEPPVSLDADDVRLEGVRLMNAIQPFAEEDVPNVAVRGQYGKGVTPDGREMPAYRGEPGVDPESRTETYAALKIMIDNWRWSGVPFYLRTGKRLARRHTEIAVQYKRPPYAIFRHTTVEELAPNVLVLRIQPNEGIEFGFGAKVPGAHMGLGSVEMDFCYADYFGSAPSTGYETLIYDCMCGDATLFRQRGGVESGWEIMQPVLDAWTDRPPEDFPNYAAGSDGPAAADELLARDGRKWRPI